MEEFTDNTETTEVEAEGQTTASEVESQEADPVFYDADLVPEHLQQSYRDMQAAWTKKTQEIAPWRKFSEFGEPDEVYEFLNRFVTTEGTVQWWFELAEQLGLSREELVAKIQGEEPAAVKPAGDPYSTEEETTAPSDDAPMTRAEFLKWQQEQQEHVQQVLDDNEIDQALKDFGVAPEDEDIVILLAHKAQGATYRDRIETAVKQLSERYTSVADTINQTRQQKRAALPPSVGTGTVPAETVEAPKTLDEAFKAANARLEAANIYNP